MSYMVEAGASSSRRARRRRAFITLGVVVVLLFSAFWYAYSYFEASTGPTASPPGPTATCTAQPNAPTPGTTTVNVYNATQRRGLAASTATQVRKRGFLVSTVANDPLQKTVTGTAEVRFGKSGAARGRLVLALVKGAKAAPDARLDSSVDLVLGNAFSALAPPPKPAPPAKTTTRRPGC